MERLDGEVGEGGEGEGDGVADGDGAGRDGDGGVAVEGEGAEEPGWMAPAAGQGAGRAAAASSMMRELVPSSLVRTTRRVEPPRETWTIWRRVVGMVKAWWALAWATGAVPQVATQWGCVWVAVWARAGRVMRERVAASRVRRREVGEKRTAGDSWRGWICVASSIRPARRVGEFGRQQVPCCVGHPANPGLKSETWARAPGDGGTREFGSGMRNSGGLVRIHRVCTDTIWHWRAR